MMKHTRSTRLIIAHWSSRPIREQCAFRRRGFIETGSKQSVTDRLGREEEINQHSSGKTCSSGD